MTNDLAKIQVALEVETARLQSELDKVNRKFDKFGKKSERTASLAKKAFIGLGAAIPVAAVAGFVDNLIQSAKEADNYAKALGISVESLTAWQYASQDAGIQADKMADIFKDTAEKIGDAYANDGGEAVEALEALGLSAKELVRLSPDQQLLAIAKQLKNVGTQAEKVQILESLASDASLLLPLLDNDAARLRELSDEARSLGIVLSQEVVDEAREFDDQMRKLQASAVGLGRELASDLLPGLNSISAAMREAAKDGGPLLALWVGLGGAASQLVFGDELQQAADKVEDLRDRLETLQFRQKNQNEGQGGWLGEKIRGVVYGSPEELEAEIQEAKSQLRTAEKHLQDMRDRIFNSPTPTPTITGTTTAGGGKAKDSETDKLLKKYNEAYLSLQKTADLIGVSTEYEKTLWEVQKGRFKDLNANQQQALLDAAQRIDQRQAEQKSIEDAAKAEEEAAKSAEKLNAQLDAQADRWRDIVNPAQGVYDQMAELDLLLETGRISWETYGDAMFQVMGELEGEAKEVENQWEELGLTFSSAFEDAIVSGENLSDILKGLEQDLLRIFTRKLVTEPLGNFASDIAGNIFSFDGGGYTGSGARVGGLDGKGGFPALLHPNETVIDHTKGQRSGMQVINNISISAPDGRISNESMSQLQARLGRSMQRSLARNS